LYLLLILRKTEVLRQSSGAYTTGTNKIKSEKENLGHMVVNIFNTKQTRTNILLPLLFVDLKPSDNNKEIYRIETLNYSKVKFEPPRTKRNIPQCSKCQRYGHTQAYCYHSLRCVKCAGNHPTKQCLRTEKSDAVTCVLCEGNHPANYKGWLSTKNCKEPSHPYVTNEMKNSDHS